MFKNIQNVILCGFVFFGIGFGLYYFWKPEKIVVPSQNVGFVKSDECHNSDTNENAEIVIKDLILKEIEKHKGLEVVVNAREGKILNSTDKIECKNINCALNDNNKQIADLRSDSALIHKTTKNVLLSGPTFGHFYDIRIDGQDISYNYSNQTLVTNKKISYHHKHFSMLAKKSSVDLKNHKITMSGGVESTFLSGPACNSNTN